MEQARMVKGRAQEEEKGIARMESQSDTDRIIAELKSINTQLKELNKNILSANNIIQMQAP